MLGSALGRVGVASSTLAPVLADIFPVIAAAAFVDLFIDLRQKILDATSALVGWDAAAKQMYEAQIRLNNQQIDSNEKLAIEAAHLPEAGLKGPALDRQKEKDDLKEKTLLQQDYNASVANEARIRKELAGTDKQVPVVVPHGDLVMETVHEGPEKDRVAELNKSLQTAMEKTQRLHEQLQELDTIRIPRQKAETLAGTQKVDDKSALSDQENWAREQERLGKEQEEAALKRADAERKANEEKERSDEGVARASEEMAQRDLESWRKTLEEKTRITISAGQDQLDQIRASAEMAEQATAKRKGPASPEIKVEAFAAYQQEIEVINELIAVEARLQEQLKATGAAADDPRILQSQQRQIALTQEASKAFDEFGKKAQQVTLAWSQTVQQAVQRVGADFSQGVVSWMNGQETFGRAMQQVWTRFADTVVSALVKAGIQMAINAAAQQALTAGTQLSNAKQAASATWANVSQIPIVGPFIAPPLAAAAFAGVMAFEHGGFVPGSGPVPIIAHGGEQVLTPAQQKERGGSSYNFSFHNHAPMSPGAARDASDAFIKRATRTMRKHGVKFA